MAFDWNEYLRLAEFLRGHESPQYTREAASRSAVSRSYFAAYCCARNYARDRDGFQPEGTAADHARLRDHYKAKGEVSMAGDLDTLRQWRNRCDYDDDIGPDFDVMVASAVHGAGEIIASLERGKT